MDQHGFGHGQGQGQGSGQQNYSGSPNSPLQFFGLRTPTSNLWLQENILQQQQQNPAMGFMGSTSQMHEPLTVDVLRRLNIDLALTMTGGIEDGMQKLEQRLATFMQILQQQQIQTTIEFQQRIAEQLNIQGLAKAMERLERDIALLKQAPPSVSIGSPTGLSASGLMSPVSATSQFSEKITSSQPPASDSKKRIYLSELESKYINLLQHTKQKSLQKILASQRRVEKLEANIEKLKPDLSNYFETSRRIADVLSSVLEKLEQVDPSSSLVRTGRDVSGQFAEAVNQLRQWGSKQLDEEQQANIDEDCEANKLEEEDEEEEEGDGDDEEDVNNRSRGPIFDGTQALQRSEESTDTSTRTNSGEVSVSADLEEHLKILSVGHAGSNKERWKTSFAAIKKLLNRQNLNSVNAKGQTLLHIYLTEDGEAYSKVFKLFNKRGFDFHRPDSDGNTALHKLMQNRSKAKEDAIRYVLEECSVNLNMVNRQNESMLHLYVRQRPIYLRTMQLFSDTMGLTGRFDINIQDLSGNTMLHVLMASFPRLDLNDDILRIVVRAFAHANFSIRNNAGQTVLDIFRCIPDYSTNLPRTLEMLESLASGSFQPSQASQPLVFKASQHLSRHEMSSSSATSSEEGSQVARKRQRKT